MNTGRSRPPTCTQNRSSGNWSVPLSAISRCSSSRAVALSRSRSSERSRSDALATDSPPLISTWAKSERSDAHVESSGGGSGAPLYLKCGVLCGWPKQLGPVPAAPIATPPPPPPAEDSPTAYSSRIKMPRLPSSKRPRGIDGDTSFEKGK
eukprot:scaffold25237_cov63-Phaeocystis_antarctica.AAC.2